VQFRTLEKEKWDIIESTNCSGILTRRLNEESVKETFCILTNTKFIFVQVGTSEICHAIVPIKYVPIIMTDVGRETERRNGKCVNRA
jgi:hypothetical protein